VRVAGILLGGGRSERFGAPKLEARFEGVRLIDRACANFLDAGLDPVVFCGDLEPSDARVLRAPRGDSMLETLNHGLRAVPSGAFAFAPADLPFLDPDLIAQLRLEFEATGCRYLIPVHAGRGGHPAFARDAAAFLDPDMEGGARAVWRSAGPDLIRFEVETCDVLYDIDTPDDLTAAASAESRRARLLERGEFSA
jgi:CTP:molybdopterin cytidylyltransferase MocA